MNPFLLTPIVAIGISVIAYLFFGMLIEAFGTVSNSCVSKPRPADKRYWIGALTSSLSAVFFAYVAVQTVSALTFYDQVIWAVCIVNVLWRLYWIFTPEDEP